MSKEQSMKHESFGQISFSRCNGSERFYGSEIQQDNYIQLKISLSEKNMDLTCERYYPYERLVQIRLTSSQFAELITSLNNGSGVPCTLEYLPGDIKKRVLPVLESRKEFIHKQFKQRMKGFSQTLKDVQSRVLHTINKKTLSKEDVRQLTNDVSYMTTEIESNIPFFSECFQETMDKVVIEAKTEVENAIQHKINVLGTDALRRNNDKSIQENSPF